MMSKIEIQKWRETGRRERWIMPKTWRISRLPIIRHVRTLWAAWGVERHYAVWESAGLLRSGYDEWVLWGLWRGLTTSVEQPTVDVSAQASEPVTDAEALDEAKMLVKTYLLATDEELTSAAQVLKRRIARAIVTAANDDSLPRAKE
jgi:hypothetical protein